MEADLSTIGKVEMWELSHIIEHQRLADRASRSGKPLSSYPLDFSFTPTWLINHNEQHRALRTQYGVNETRDFSVVDTKNSADLDSWVADHYLEHQQLAAKV